MSKEVPLTRTLDVIPLTLKPSSFPEHVVDMWRLRLDEHFERPSEAEEGDLMGVDIAHMLVSAAGYPESEVLAYFFLEGGICDVHVLAFPCRSADSCFEIRDAFRESVDLLLICNLFAYSEWHTDELRTLVFRDFTLLFDGSMRQDDADFSAKMKLILHKEATGKSPAQLKQDIELSLNGFAKARNGLDRVRFSVDLGS